MSKYYDWHKALSNNAEVKVVIGAKGAGKAYALRKQRINNFTHIDRRFVGKHQKE